jgi:hypothetical protein
MLFRNAVTRASNFDNLLGWNIRCVVSTDQWAQCLWNFWKPDFNVQR